MSTVCVLVPAQAEAVESSSVRPDCKGHGHITHKEADRLVAAEFDDGSRLAIEGWGRARTLPSLGDGRRRLALIPRILGYRHRNGSMQAVLAEFK